jgi:hypothetical protein
MGRSLHHAAERWLWSSRPSSAYLHRSRNPSDQHHRLAVAFQHD